MGLLYLYHVINIVFSKSDLISTLLCEPAKCEGKAILVQALRVQEIEAPRF
jgi:hypothetical protein